MNSTGFKILKLTNILSNRIAGIKLSSNSKQVINNEITQQFILHLPHCPEYAFVRYERYNGALNLLKLHIPEDYRHLGLGQFFAEEVLKFCLQNNMQVKLTCPFLHDYFRKQRKKRWYESACREGASNIGDPGIALIRAFSLIFVDRVSESLDTLRPFISQPKASVAAIMASIYAHNHCQVIERAAVSSLETLLKDERRNLDKSDLYYESLHYYLANNYNKAQSCLEDMLKNEPNSSRVQSLLGWIQIALKKQRTALKHFGLALQQDRNNPDALLGEIMSLSPIEGLNKVNSLVVKYPKAVIPLIEKMKLQLANRNWEHAMDTALRTLGLQSDNIPALQMRALKLVVDGKYEETIPVLRKLHAELERQEPKAWWLFLKVVSAFSRCCGRNTTILLELDRFAKSSLRMGSHILHVLLEVGHLNFLAGRLDEAELVFKEAAKDDAASISLAHLSKVHLALYGITPEVKEQIEFLTELDEKKENAEVLLMRAELNLGEAVELLDKAVSVQQNKSAQHKFGIDYLTELDPELLMRISHAYPNNNFGEKRRIRVLNLVVETCPGLIDAGLGLAQAQMAIGDFSDASTTLINIIENTDPTNPHAYLLSAYLFLEQGDYDSASNKLEHGLSNNLNIRESPQYHLLTGLVARHRGDDSFCINSIRQAISMNSKGDLKLNQKDLGTAYAELSGAHMRLNDLKQASQDLKEANDLLKGTDQESTVVIGQAQLSALEGDIRKALTLLSEIPKENNNYIKAQMQKADIYLNHLKDGHSYANCYKKLVDSDPTAENYIMLGDAYMAIQEPELAVQSYEKAMVNNTGNTNLSCKLARVLVRCHQYQKAIKCYKSSGDDGSLELAELQLKLGQPEKAEQALVDLPLSKKALTLAKVYEKSGDLHKALKTLRDAQEESGRGDLLMTAKLCQQMALYANLIKDHNSAIDYYKKALSYSPGETSIQIALAKLYMEVNDWNACEVMCKSLLNKDNQNEPALLMVADLALRRVDFSAALTHFSSLLTRKPDYWVALARLVEVARRSAKLEQALPYIEAARAVESNHPGLHYCTGLYHWYRGELQLAVQSFNGARGDPEWGSQAVHNMIEVCIGQSTAHKLLAELKPQTQDEETGLLLLTSFVRLAAGDRAEVERAVIDFTTLANNETHRVGATLGLGMGYIDQNQSARAKAVLKRLAKHPWSLEEAEYLERCWLLLADLYIQAGSQQQAADLLQRVITHNLSSARAYELLGVIAEKDQNYSGAGQHFLQAWTLTGESSPSLGYKLGYNQLKSKRYSEAVATCQKVLTAHPDYPKIKKDILDKAIPRLRS